MTDVKCSVNSCTYWGTGNRCEADTIFVDNNIGEGDDMEIGKIGGDPADVSEQTCCRTFKPGEKKKKKQQASVKSDEMRPVGE